MESFIRELLVLMTRIDIRTAGSNKETIINLQPASACEEAVGCVAEGAAAIASSNHI
jgi:hypothetical protein